MNAELSAALQKPAIAERMLSLGAEPFESTPEQAVAYIKSELVNWAAVAKASGTKAD
jgi:tripartite-type tricarboxylate transporter receptor subunit TctC